MNAKVQHKEENGKAVKSKVKARPESQAPEGSRKSAAAGVPIFLQSGRQGSSASSSLLPSNATAISQIQRQVEGEEELVQPKSNDGVVQRQPIEEEEALLQPSWLVRT